MLCHAYLDRRFADCLEVLDRVRSLPYPLRVPTLQFTIRQ